MSGQTEKGTIEETETATPVRHLVLRRVQAGEAVPAGDRAAELADVRQQLHPHHTLVTLLSHSGHTLLSHSLLLSLLRRSVVSPVMGQAALPRCE